MPKKTWLGYLPQDVYAEIISASGEELEETNQMLTEIVDGWDGIPSLAHYTALEALILIRLAQADHDFRPLQGDLMLKNCESGEDDAAGAGRLED